MHARAIIETLCCKMANAGRQWWPALRVSVKLLASLHAGLPAGGVQAQPAAVCGHHFAGEKLAQ